MIILFASNIILQVFFIPLLITFNFLLFLFTTEREVKPTSLNTFFLVIFLFISIFNSIFHIDLLLKNKVSFPIPFCKARHFFLFTCLSTRLLWICWHFCYGPSPTFVALFLVSSSRPPPFPQSSSHSLLDAPFCPFCVLFANHQFHWIKTSCITLLWSNLLFTRWKSPLILLYTPSLKSILNLLILDILNLEIAPFSS